MKTILINLHLFLLMAMTLSCSDNPTKQAKFQDSRSFEQILGTHFNSVEKKHYSPPSFEALTIPEINKTSSIWGATGRDDQGNIYLGVSSRPNQNNTAYLYQYSPEYSQFSLQSDVISELKKSGLHEEGMSQNKIHSKIYQANDGYLYFTSFDEKGENAKKGIPPKHGGHLWRKKPNAKNWEHILATKEALIALNTNGQYIYSLGYWGHVLYQFDTLSEQVKSINLKSLNQHISRNFLVTPNGHVFVPYILNTEENQVAVTLNEYDSDLMLVSTYSLEHYLNLSEYSQHGIISYTTMTNGDIYFITGQGALYSLKLSDNNSYEVNFEIFLDDEQQKGSYLASLFTLDGQNFLAALGRQKSTPGYSWIVYETSLKVMASFPISSINKKTLLYGSVTRDDQGNLYIVGTDMTNKKQHKPTIIKASYN